MNPYLLLTGVAAVGSFLILRKYRPHQENEEIDSSSSSSLVPSSSSSSALSHNWTYEVFPSFRGEDVRGNILSHILKEFKRKGITPFIDNEIRRGESIAPELISAIRGSKIAIVLLSRNYASSKWCLNELVEIMKCRKELGQIVLSVFYRVDPSDVKKLTGDFGKVFKKTCKGRSKEETERWRKALEEVATIAGYHSNNWDNEADMIEKIANDVSSELIVSAPSSDFNDFVGMRAHMEEMEQFLCLGSDGVMMIGIWGPSGIGKSTIARFLFGKYSPEFQLSVFMDNVKRSYPRPCHDEYTAKLQLQTKMLSEIINLKNIKIDHLGVVQDRLKDKRVLIVLDDVDHLMQLHAMAKETWWFGPGSRIIITTQDKGVLSRHGIKRIYEVGFPADDEALQIFCMSAFGQKFPEDGFEDLASEFTWQAGNLPLGLKIMGSHLRGMSKYEWEMELPRLWSSLDGEIESILKYSYDALCDEDKDLFVYIACFFNNERTERVEALLAKKFSSVRRGLQVLAEKSLISLWKGIDMPTRIDMHDLLVRFGREIDRKQSNGDRGQLKFLVDEEETCQVLSDYTQSRINARGMRCEYSEIEDELYKSDKVLERMRNLQFLDVSYDTYPSDDTYPREHLPESLKYLPPQLILLRWEDFPMTCLPTNFNPEFLVEIIMPNSKLVKLWEGIQTITNLKWMTLEGSKSLKELPDLSTASNLQNLDLSGCSSLVELPSSIGNATNLRKLYLSDCSSLLELPSFIGNLRKLHSLNLRGCSSLVELPSSIGNLHKLHKLDLSGCSKLEALPMNINMESLEALDLSDCSSLKMFPEISTNIEHLGLKGTAIEEIPSSIRSWTRLQKLVISQCTKLISVPQLPNSLQFLEAQFCKSLEKCWILFPSLSPKLVR